MWGRTYDDLFFRNVDDGFSGAFSKYKNPILIVTKGIFIRSWLAFVGDGNYHGVSVAISHCHLLFE